MLTDRPDSLQGATTTGSVRLSERVWDFLVDVSLLGESPACGPVSAHSECSRAFQSGAKSTADWPISQFDFTSNHRSWSSRLLKRLFSSHLRWPATMISDELSDRIVQWGIGGQSQRVLSQSFTPNQCEGSRSLSDDHLVMICFVPSKSSTGGSRLSTSLQLNFTGDDLTRTSNIPELVSFQVGSF